MVSPDKRRHQPGTGGEEGCWGQPVRYAWPTHADVSRPIGDSSLRMTRKGGVLEDPRPKARVDGVTDIGVNYKMRYWIVPADISPSAPSRSRRTTASSTRFRSSISRASSAFTSSTIRA